MVLLNCVDMNKWLGHFTMMTVSHRFHLEPFSDGILIERTFDGGNTWVVVAEDTAPPFFNMGMQTNYSSLDTLPSGEPVLTGSSSRYGPGWFNTGIMYMHMNLKKAPSAVAYRFTFIADSVNSGHQGWAIMKISISSQESWSVPENNYRSLKVFPNPTAGIVSIASETGLPLNIMFYDCTGRLLHEAEVPVNEPVDLGHLKSHGLILYRAFSQAGEIYQGKILLH